MAKKNGDDGWHRSRTFMGGAIIAARGEQLKMAKKNWMIDAGNSSEGQIGFTVYGIKAETAEDALALVKTEMLEELHDAVYTTPGVGRWEVNVYFNTDALTLDNVCEDDSENEEDEDDEADRIDGLDPNAPADNVPDLTDDVLAELAKRRKS